MSDAETSSGASAGSEPSEAQRLLDRMKAQCERFNDIRKDLEAVRASIARNPEQRRPPPDAARVAPVPAKSFFEALNIIADVNDEVANEFEKSVKALGALF